LAGNCRSDCEEWVRAQWLPKEFGQQFHKGNLPLSSGGRFEFDAISEDGRIAACISTSSATTGSGNRASAKVQKLQADMLFLTPADASEPLISLTERSMYELCVVDQSAGRVPTKIKFYHARLPDDLANRLKRDQDRLSERFRGVPAANARS
jgi:hypothetical protein